VNRRMTLALALSAVALAAPLAVMAADAVSPAVTAALAGSHRSEANRARDVYRHPAQTLAFFGFKPEMTVVEVSPGGGWYTEVLAAALHGKGTYYAANFRAEDGDYQRKALEGYKAKLATAPAVYGEVKITPFGKDNYDSIAPAGSADLVLTFRNVHNWLMAGDGQAEGVFKGFYKALKPGGTLGVVEHRLPEGRPDADQQTSGYVKQSTVVRLAEQAGFKLVASSEVNANPRDNADHPKGVWTLPPSFALGDEDRAKYAAIGESDRMTLKFVKPGN
jgi:predicted methyltransferase